MRRSNDTPRKARNIIFRLLGPGLVTGAADDDPSGIATYSQAGAHFGYGLLWTVFLTTPFMIAIQLVSAQIGRVTGQGIVANTKQFYPRAIVIGLVGLLVIANKERRGPEGDNWLFFSIADSRYAQASASVALPPYFPEEEENEMDRRKRPQRSLRPHFRSAVRRKSRKKTSEQAATRSSV